MILLLSIEKISILLVVITFKFYIICIYTTMGGCFGFGANTKSPRSSQQQGGNNYTDSSK
jgi:hypothetical protein